MNEGGGIKEVREERDGEETPRESRKGMWLRLWVKSVVGLSATEEFGNVVTAH